MTRGAVVAERVPGGFAAVYQVLRAVRSRAGAGAATSSSAWAPPSSPRPAPSTGCAPTPPTAVPSPTDSAGESGGTGPGGGSAAQTVGPAGSAPGAAGGGGLPGGGAGGRRPGEAVRRRAALAGAPADGDGGRGHRPGRKAGALVVLVDGELVLYVERGGRTLLSWTEDPTALQAAADALALAVREGGLGRLAVERADGESVHTSTALAEALEAAGFRPTPRGLRLRA